jgi:hypothetical protein
VRQQPELAERLKLNRAQGLHRASELEGDGGLDGAP